ncbi:MAG: sulfatase [Acidobacteria bacterium]|nr:sulfatase [Acidobacteriota bacterium]
MKSLRLPSHRLWWALLAGAALSCQPRGDLTAAALVDALHHPDILTEARVLDFLPSLGPNRFVHGWWGWREDHVLRMVPYEQPARLEITSLSSRPRTLKFLTKVHRLPAEGTVEVRVDGRKVAELPLDPSSVELPALPVGRYPVDFIWPEGSEVGIEKAEFEQALPAGQVRIGDDAVIQSGYSAVDFVRRLPAGTRLRGSFSPPANARSEQSFQILIEREGEAAEEVFSWPPSWWRRWRGPSFDVPLRSTEGLVRIRLLAHGTGEPGRWRELTITTPATPPEPAPVVPAAPKLVLLYVMDALRADAVGHLGGGAQATPLLDRLAAEGVTFVDHQSLAPNTLPSTKTLFTGRPVLESNRKRLSRQGPPLLAELFQQAGYRTALLSGNGYVSDFYGVTRGFEHLDRGVLYEFHPKTTYNDNAEWVHRAALDWLRGLEPDERAFLYLHTVHPHTPYSPPAEFVAPAVADLDSTISGDSDTLVRLRQGEIEASQDDRERLATLYRGGLAYNDRELDRLLNEILARYAAGEVLLVVTSDHGEEFFDHGGVLHGYTLYRDQLHVPLVVWWPGTLAPHRVEAATDTQDLYVTLRRLVSEYEPQLLAGRSLWPLLLDSGSVGGKEIRFAAAPGVPGGIFAAYSRGRKLVWAPRKGSQWGVGDGPGRTHEAEYVFDLRTDPDEANNLAGDSSMETDWLRSRLLAWIELGRALQPGSEDAELDEAMESNLRALGYLD